MRVALIVPIEFLDKYCNPGIQYCLPRLIVESERYRAFFISRQKEGDYIMLDARRPGWRRTPEEYSIISQAIKLIYPSLVIYPSYMYNTLKTVSEASKFVETFKVVGAACLEGPDTESIAYCQSQIRPVYTFAIPSHIYPVQKTVKDWVPPIIYVDNHLNIEELEGLNGILATSLPFRLGALGRIMRDYLPSPPSLDFFSKEDPFPKIVERNIQDTLEYYSKKKGK